MFFIHGGAFTDEWYGPDFIVDDDVILVTSNYRLGPWGFVSFGIKGYTGNMGFKDQQMALEWTHRNIENFGGDPNQITVFGESVGKFSAKRNTKLVGPKTKIVTRWSFRSFANALGKIKKIDEARNSNEWVDIHTLWTQ